MLNDGGGHVGVEPLHAAGGDQGGQADDVGHRQVEAADQDHQRLPDGDQAEHAHRGQDRPDVALGEEVASLDGGQHGRADDDGDEHEVDQAAVEAVRGGCRGGAHAAPPCGDPVRWRLRWRWPARPPRSPPAASSPGQGAVAHDQDPVGHPDHLGQLAGDHQHGDAGSGQLAHQLVDAVLGADVDAAGGLVHQHDQRVDAQPAGEHHLLLVAAGEELHLLAEAVRGDVEVGQHARHVAARGGGAAREDRADDAEGVVEDRLVERQALGLAVLGDEGEAGAYALARAADLQRGAVEADAAPRHGVHAEDGLQQLGASRALESGQPDDLAGADLERDVVDVGVADPGQRQAHLADLDVDRLVGEVLRQRAPDHQPHQLALGELGGRAGWRRAGRP